VSVEEHQGLVVFLLDRFLAKNPTLRHLHDDLKSEGMLALTQAVNENKPTASLNRYIRKAFIIAVNNESTIRIPIRTLSRYAKEGEPIVQPTKETSLEWTDSVNDPDPRPLIDLWDELLACCETEVDKSILTMRRDGYKDEDIAPALEIQVSTVHFLRGQIQKRFNNRVRERGGVV
jgi:DNA-directed RNA polymerase specialized sigma24 family protein